MARARTVFACADCGTTSPRWVGRCPGCGAWNTLVEEPVSPPSGAAAAIAGPRSVARPIEAVDCTDAAPRAIGLPEVDRVLGGGIVPGSVSLLGGEPGIGKSTLLLQIAGAYAAQGRRVLYVSGEESATQVRDRAARLRVLHGELWVVAEGDVDVVAAHIAAVQPTLVVIDSIQMMADPALTSSAGSVGQVRECAAKLAGLAKRAGVAMVLVGHVTKDGSLAGPRVLEHLVDTVLSFEGDRHHALRVLRALKHRYGATDELGLFEMGERGLEPVPDPSRLFLADRAAGTPGSVLLPTVEGQRPFIVEVQALSTASPLNRRVAEGLDAGRLSFLLAVLNERIGLPTIGKDVYALAVGGVQVNEPAADLALCMALASAFTAQPIPAGVAAYGEVGLGGELRRVGHHDRRAAECVRMGIDTLVLPATAPSVPAGVTCYRVKTLREAFAVVDLLGTASGERHRQAAAANELDSRRDRASRRNETPRGAPPGRARDLPT
jgi:DNA repair protein RadA/Sms